VTQFVNTEHRTFIRLYEISFLYSCVLAFGTTYVQLSVSRMEQLTSKQLKLLFCSAYCIN